MSDSIELIESLKDFFLRSSTVYGIDMGFLYGSYARGLPRADSDVDIAVLFSEEPSSEEESFEGITDISLSLSREVKWEVNLIEIHRDFRKPMLYYNAIVLGMPLYIREWSGYITLRNEAIHQMEDFSRLGIPWQYEIARRNLEAIGHG